MQAYEAQSDWHKVRIGEKVDIFVPDLKISIEAEIVEMSIDFQNYATALKIATTKNYDKRFGKYFANVYTLLQNTFQNIIKPTQKSNEGAVVFIKDKKSLIESNLSGGPVNIGSSTGDGESNNTQNQPSMLALGTVVIDPLTEQLVTTVPPELFPIYGNSTIGTAKITNGGFYIKDKDDNLRVALNAKDGFIGYKQNSETGDTEETFKIDLNGNATFAGQLEAATGTFSGDLQAAGGTFNSLTIEQNGELIVNRQFPIYEGLVVQSQSLPSGYIISNVVYQGDELAEVFPLSATTGNIISETNESTAVTKQWMILPNYTGIALVEEDRHSDPGNSPNNYSLGIVVFFQGDGAYYEVIGVVSSTGTTIYYIILSIPTEEGPDKIYAIPLNFSTPLYQMPSRRITHE